MAHGRIRSVLGWLLGALLLVGCRAVAAEHLPAQTTATPTSTAVTGNPTPVPTPITLPPVDPAAVTGPIIAAGSSTVFPLAQRIAEEFQNGGYNGQITIDSIGSGAGFERFCIAAQTDIATLNRAIRAEEQASCRQRGREPLAFRLGSDAVAVLVSTENDFVQDVTLDELALLFSTAATWQDVRPTWPAEPILRYSPGTDSGAFDYFVEVVFDEDPARLLNARNLQLSENNRIVAQGIAASPYAIGYFGYTFADQRSEPLRMLALNGTAPTSQTIDVGSYPLTRPLFLYSDGGIMHAKPQVAAFLNYALTNATDLIGPVGYTRATTATLNQAKQTWLAAMASPPPIYPLYLPLVRQGGSVGAGMNSSKSTSLLPRQGGSVGADGALAIVVSAENDFVQDVTLEELARLFSFAADTWQDVRPAWPAEPIRRYSPGTNSDTFAAFVEALFDGAPEPLLNAGNLTLRNDVAAVVQGVASSPYAIGVVRYGTADQLRGQLRLLALDGVAPTEQSIGAGHYPLERLRIRSTATDRRRAHIRQAIRPTPMPTPVPGIIPDGWEVIERYRSPTEKLAPDYITRGMRYDGTWWAGALLAKDGYPRRLLVMTHRNACLLYIKPMGLDGFVREAFRRWSCPEQHGRITITGVASPTGIITFTNDLTQTVTFNLATEEWTWPSPIPGVIPYGWWEVGRDRSRFASPFPDYVRRDMRYRAWWAGVIMGANGYPQRLVATTHKRHCTLFIDYLGVDDTQVRRFLPEERQTWACPEDMGAIEIVDVTGPTGIITFTDKLDRTVTFNLATEEWTLDGKVWEASATPTPAAHTSRSTADGL